MSVSVDNSFRHDFCPFCRALDIVKVGVINYDLPILFSSTKIELLNSPELWRCRRCFSGFTQNAITPDEALRLYTNSESSLRWSDTPFERQKMPEVVQAMKSVFSSCRHVVDVGCNTGELLDFAKSLGCKTTGVELSTGSRTKLLEKGHTFTSALRNLQDQSADVITAFDLIEHVHDINAFLSLCGKKLKVGGKLMVLTGNINCVSSRLAGSDWWYSRYPEHIAFPSRSFVARWSGFELLEAIPTYASIGYRAHRIRSILSWIVRTPLGKYRGLPAIGPDHYLYILKK